MNRIAALRTDPRATRVLLAVVVVALAIFPFFRDPLDGRMDDAIIALTYVLMALGLNLVVGFAGLLDLGYVAFFAFGALVAGWWASDFYSGFAGGGVHLGVTDIAANAPGIHLNFLVLLVGAMIVCAIAGVLIGLPTLRLRGDYIAIVTLAFGEIIGRVAANGDKLTPFGDYKVSPGREAIAPLDQITLPVVGEFNGALNLRPFFWLMLGLCLVVLFVNFRLRDSRLGRAWIALREDEVAAVSMGVPLVKTKLLAYGVGATFGGIAGVFLALFTSILNPNTFQFGISIIILGMVILGGLGSIWGVALGAALLSLVNTWVLPDVLDKPGIHQDFLDLLGLEFSFAEVKYGIFGFILLLMMVLRPEGLIPERRHKMELRDTEGGGPVAGATSVYEARA